MARITPITVFNRIVLPILGRYGGTTFWKQNLALRRAARLPLEERRRMQLERLNALLKEAAVSVPLYRDRLAGTRAAQGLADLEQLRELPITTKEDLQAGFPDRVVHAQADRRTWQYVSSSGTVSRVVTVKDFDRRDQERASLLHTLRAGSGYRPGLPIVQIPANICNLMCGVDATNEDESFRREMGRYVWGKLRRSSPDISNLRGAFDRRMIFRSRMLNPLCTVGTQVEADRLREYWERIRAERPYLVQALPEYLYLLAEWARAEGKPPLGASCYLPMGAGACGYVRRRIERGLGGRFLDYYGTAELGPVAFESAPGEGMRPVLEHFVLEIERDGRPCAPGEMGMLLITDLNNRAMPFIRYEVGDLAMWADAPPGAQDASPRLRVVGRPDQVLPGRDGDLIRPDTLQDHLLEQAGLLAFSLRERRSGRLQIDYVPAAASVDGARVVETLRALVGDGPVIKARQVRNIAPETSGKFRFIQCERRLWSGRAEPVDGKAAE